MGEPPPPPPEEGPPPPPPEVEPRSTPALPLAAEPDEALDAPLLLELLLRVNEALRALEPPEPPVELPAMPRVDSLPPPPELPEEDVDPEEDDEEERELPPELPPLLYPDAKAAEEEPLEPPPPPPPVESPEPGPCRLPRSCGATKEAKFWADVLPVTRTVRSRLPTNTCAVRTGVRSARPDSGPGSDRRASHHQLAPRTTTKPANTQIHRPRGRPGSRGATSGSDGRISGTTTGAEEAFFWACMSNLPWWRTPNVHRLEVKDLLDC
jgi:hypothetical protein